MPINPYSHTSFIKNPGHGRKLYADEIHRDMVGISNQFTPTPTVNKYAHSAESMTEIANLPALAHSPYSDRRRSSSTKSDNQTINKRKLTLDSIYDLHQIPCPFSNQHNKEEHIGSKKRRSFTEESRYELDQIPDPFQPRELQSDYLIDASYNSRPTQVQSSYAFSQPIHHYRRRNSSDLDRHDLPERDQKTMNKYVRSALSQSDLRNVPSLQSNPVCEYCGHKSSGGQTPTHSSYDYSAYAQPAVLPPPPTYMPPSWIGPQQGNPYAFYPMAYPWYTYTAHPMYHFGSPYYPPYFRPPQRSASEPSDVNAGMDQARVSDFFEPGSIQGQRHRRRFTPNNETVNKNLRGADSIAELEKVDVDFEPKRMPSNVSHGSPNEYRIRDFSVDSIRDINALPSISQMSLYNTPSKNVQTAKTISSVNTGKLLVPASSS
ncbi:hypothetical protein RB195_018117 [Necator americanus]|uniref:Uncharacterized protein n=1 Tax=Necator americanus TaxID=51031 RepID=A0ABR1C9V1_NECAM